MKSLKYILLVLTCGIVTSSFAQMEDPTTWSYEVKKKSATEYTLIVHLQIKDKWHIWSMSPGGDGSLIAPSFSFDNNAKVKLKGKVAEKGMMTTTVMEGIDGKVNYLSGKVDYVQEVTVSGPTKITGKHTYQVCNDMTCLAPKDKDFVFEIK